MKNILNNLSDEEKNSIREQHTGGMRVVTENFHRLLGSKLGDVKPLVSEQTIASNILSGSSQKAVKQVFDSCGNVAQSPYNTNKIVDGIYRAVQGVGTDEASIIRALTDTRDLNTFCSAVKNYKATYGTDLYSDLDGDIDEETVGSNIKSFERIKTSNCDSTKTYGRCTTKTWNETNSRRSTTKTWNETNSRRSTTKTYGRCTTKTWNETNSRRSTTKTYGRYKTNNCGSCIIRNNRTTKTTNTTTLIKNK
jgi:hypothetical protein